MARRSELDVLHAVLHSISRGYDSKTALIRYAGVGAKQLQEYLSYAMEKDIIEEREGRLALTEKGKKVLEELERISELQAEIASRINTLREIIDGEKET